MKAAQSLREGDRDIAERFQETLAAVRCVRRIGKDLTSLHDREQLLERAVWCLTHDLSYEGAFVITESRPALQPPSGSEIKSDQTWDHTRVLIPIQFDSELLGTIVIPMTAGRRMTDANHEILSTFAEFLGIGLNNARRIEEISQLAFVDPLTGAMNRRHLEILPQELARTKSMAVIAFDIDLLKVINDTYGHLAGDVVLRCVAERAKECIRKTDQLARYGGDEFVIVLPRTGSKSAREIAERIRASIERSAVMIEDQPVYCTISAGIAYSARGVDINSLMNRADQALYAAKHSGGNLVCSAQRLNRVYKLIKSGVRA